ncbi:glycosyltransferase family 2 protein [Chloroflexota bacterium]
MNYPKIAIIVLNWNGLDDTIQCLESLKKITYSNYEIVVVDNGSAGDDADILKGKYGESVRIIRKSKNYGFTGGNNIAIRWLVKNSYADYFLLLNNDTTVDSEFITEMVKACEVNPEIGIGGPKTYYFDDPLRFQLVWFKVDMRFGKAYLVGAREFDRGQYENITYVDYIAGSCFLIKRNVIEEIGLLDDSYFAYWEETDYCIRARRARYKIVYVPKAKIWHKVSQTVGLLSPFVQYYNTKNRFRFMKKHATKIQYFYFLLYFLYYFFWWASALDLVRHRNMKRWRAFLRGVKDGIFLKI